MELIENKDLFQTVFDSAANGIEVIQSIYDDNGNVEDFTILLLNTFILKRTGVTDYKGKRYKEVFPVFAETGMLKTFIDVAKTGVTASFEHAGIEHWFLYTVVKQAGLLVVTVVDITERKQAEIALNKALNKAEKQERLYNSITNNTPDLVYVFDLSYRFVYANKALLAMWGKSAEDAIGRGLRENGYEEWHAQMHEREIDKIVATKKSIRGTVSFPHAELGKRVYDYILVPVFNEKGEVEAIAGTTRDITDIKRAEEKLQQSEARFRNLLQEAPIAATLFRGPDLIIEIANELTQKYWRKSSAIIGKPVAEAAPELEDQQMIALLNDMYRHGGTASFSEVPIAFIKDGVLEEGYYTFSIKALYDNSNKVESILSIGIDVTEQVKARKQVEASESRYKILAQTLEQQVNERTKELQRSNEDLQQFAHVASHDLKEPVRKIKTFTNRLEDQLNGKLDESATRFIGKIHVAAERMSNMIDGVLAYSTINASEQKTELVDLNDVFKNIEADLEIPLQKTNGQIQYHNLPMLEGAPVLLYQLFYNLINNSIKFAKDGVPPQITLSSEQDKNFVCLTLQDNGIGFEPDLSMQIFETFTRLNSKDKYEGTGLGLSLCKKIVERHGGTIHADGSKDNGAKFIITLPLKQKGEGI